MLHFQTKNHNLGKFFRVLQRKMLVHFMALSSTLRPFDIFYGHLVCFMAIWYILWYFAIGISPVLVRCSNKHLATLITGLSLFPL
jgi:hypothetical protein